MEFRRDSTEQISVRPKSRLDPAAVKSFNLPVTYVPPMSGLETDEPVYRPAKQDDLLGKGKPGTSRKLFLTGALIRAGMAVLVRVDSSLVRLRTAGPRHGRAGTSSRNTVRHPGASPRDVASGRIALMTGSSSGTANGPRGWTSPAGSGFQQVLMLLTFLHTRPSSILLLDQPHVHLHVTCRRDLQLVACSSAVAATPSLSRQPTRK